MRLTLAPDGAEKPMMEIRVKIRAGIESHE